MNAARKRDSIPTSAGKLVVSLVSCASLLLVASSAFAWTQDRFILAIWGDPWIAKPIDQNWSLNEKRLRAVHDAHLNLLKGDAAWGYDMSYLDRVLDLCVYTDLYTLVSISTPADKLGIDFKDPCTFDPSCRQFDRKTYEKTLSYRQHFLPGQLSSARRARFYGYFLGDEPEPIAKYYLPLKDVLQNYKQFDPGALAFLNLYSEFPNRRQYLAYIDSMCNDPNPSRRPDVISFDHYPYFQTHMTTSYFDNLSILRQTAGQRPLWACVLTTGFENVADPTPVQIRFMTNCPIAYGAKGFIYFTYNQLYPNKNHFRHGVVDNADFPTPTYDVIKNINHYIEKVVGPVVMSSQWREASHVSVYPSGQVFPSSEIFRADRSSLMASISGKTMLCAVFDAAHASYVWVVNKDTTNTNAATIWLKGNRSGQVFLGPTEMHYAGETTYAPWPATYDASRQATKLDPVRLAPAEGRMIRVGNAGP